MNECDEAYGRRQSWKEPWARTYTAYRTGLSFLVVRMVKESPAIWETWVSSLGWEDLLEEGMATHSSILSWKILMDRGAWQTTVHGFT